MAKFSIRKFTYQNLILNLLTIAGLLFEGFLEVLKAIGLIMAFVCPVLLMFYLINTFGVMLVLLLIPVVLIVVLTVLATLYDCVEED
jgi:hypothetical protein